MYPWTLRACTRTITIIIISIALMLPGFLVAKVAPANQQRVIVQGGSVAATQQAVVSVGGTVQKVLRLIDGVVANVPTDAIARLQDAGLVVTPDYDVASSQSRDMVYETGTTGLPLYPSAAVGTHSLSDQGINGQGVTVAFVDSGFPAMESAKSWIQRLDAQTLYAAQNGQFIVYRDMLYQGSQLQNSSDPFGHGSHVVMTLADNFATVLLSGMRSKAVGVAPRANMVMVRVLDENGQGSYGTVIEAIEWIVSQKERWNIRVLNLSLDGPVVAPYWVDPLGRAVMRAWEAGLVVVVAGGNRGPEPMTIGVPGNVPYVITVGAVTSGRYTESRYDELAWYSSAGPTESRFVKPDVVVPASRTIAVLPMDSMLVRSGAAGLVTDSNRPVLEVGKLRASDFGYYKVSGTSMAAAEVSGVVALMLQRQPWLTNDQVKHRLLATAKPAWGEEDGIYAIWQQGAGRVDALAAVLGESQESANAGMDISGDLLAEGIHYLGQTAFDGTANSFHLTGQPLTEGGYRTWDGAVRPWAGGYRLWSEEYQPVGNNHLAWSTQGELWQGSYRSWYASHGVWSGGFQVWGGGFQIWGGGYQIWGGSLVPEN